MAKSVKTYPEPTHDEIAARAHSLYEKEGRPEGKAQEHWLKAESQLLAERKTQNAEKPGAATGKTAQESPKGNWPAPPRRQGLSNGIARK